MRLVSALYRFDAPLGLRELAELCSMSPAGMADLLRRLEERQVIKLERRGNRVLYSLCLSKEEEGFLRSFLAQHLSQRCQERAKLFSQRRDKAVAWIDESIIAWRSGKRVNAT